MFKNVAGQKIALVAWDTNTGTYKTGDASNLTFYVNKDWAGINALTDTSATELSATNAPGRYVCDLTQAETNADALDFTGKSSTGGIIVVPLLIFTFPASFTSSVAQTGDSYAIVNNGTYGNSALNTAIGGVSTSVAAVPTAVQNADAFLNRSLLGGSNTGQLVKEALYHLRCAWNISSGILSVKDPTGAVSWTRTVTVNPAAQAITGVS